MNHDVAVVGGGLVGSVLACATAKLGLRTAAIESRDPPTRSDTNGYDLRVSAISRSSEAVLRHLGVWERLPAERMGVFREMHVWDATGEGEIHFDAAEVGATSLGHIIENRVLEHALAERMRDFAGLKVYRPATLDDLAIADDHAVARVSGTRLQTRLVVGADGSRSRVRELAGIGHDTEGYGQRAVVATLRTELGHRETAWQRFFPTGPLAFLPLPDGHVSIVWSTTPDDAQALLDMEAHRFAEVLEAAFESRLGRLTLVGERAAFPLMWLHAARYVSPRVALVGDAAHTVHPLAGQGANLGIQDAAALAETIEAADARGRDIGALASLRRYERWRRGHNQVMQQALSGFKWLFGSRLPPVERARNVGLSVTDRLLPAKRFFMRYASGLAGDLPKIARPGPWR